MSSGEGMSLHAEERIRGFSVLVTLVGLAIVVALAIPLFSGAGSGASGSNVEVGSTYDEYWDPWEDPNPLPAQQDGVRWSGRGQQYIELTDLTPGEPLLLSFIGEHDAVRDVYLSDAVEVTDSDSVAAFDPYGEDSVYLIPTGTEAFVWLSTRTTEPWTVRIQPATLDERSGVVSGVGTKNFLYTGKASAARVIARGDSSVWINVVTAQGTTTDTVQIGPSGGSIAWPDTPAAIIRVENHGGGSSWSIEFLEPAGEQSSETPTAQPGNESAEESDE